jgi:hypothetical protein
MRLRRQAVTAKLIDELLDVTIVGFRILVGQDGGLGSWWRRDGLANFVWDRLLPICVSRFLG